MNKTFDYEYEVNQANFVTYYSLKSLYEMFKPMYSEEINTKLENLLKSLSETLDVPKGFGNILDSRVFIKVVADNQKIK